MIDKSETVELQVERAKLHLLEQQGRKLKLENDLRQRRLETADAAFIIRSKTTNLDIERLKRDEIIHTSHLGRLNWAMRAVFGDEDEVTTYLGNGISDSRIVQVMTGMKLHKRAGFVDRLVSENPNRNEWPAPVTKILEINKAHDDRWEASVSDGLTEDNAKPMPEEAIKAQAEAQEINIGVLEQTLDELALSFSTMVDVDNINRVYSILTGESVSQLQVIARTAATLRPANEVTQDELKQILDKHTLTDKPDIELSTNKLPSDQTTFIIAQDISSNGQNKIEGVIQYIASLEKAGMPVDILSYQAIGKHLDIELHREQSNDTETNSGGPTGSATY